MTNVESNSAVNVRVPAMKEPLWLARALTVTAREAWRPRPIRVPQVDPSLTNLPALERAAEVVRFKLLQLEYAIAPDGVLRGWFRLVVLIGLILGIPAFFLVPVISFLLQSFTVWTEFVFHAVLNIFYTCLAILGILIVVMLVGAFLTRK